MNGILCGIYYIRMTYTRKPWTTIRRTNGRSTGTKKNRNKTLGDRGFYQFIHQLPINTKTPPAPEGTEGVKIGFSYESGN